MALSVKSPAKINLFLHITGRQPNGYHRLQTVFQFLDFSDELKFATRQDSQINCFIEPASEHIDNNLVTRAGKLLQIHTKTKLGADIYLKKNIWMGAGLGGGSSNAATTLVALNELWDCGLSNKELQKLGLQLGADVPIFIYGKSAFAEGIGEQFTPIDPPELYYVLVNPGCHVSTELIFKSGITSKPELIISPEQFALKNTVNHCEPKVCARYPQVGAALRWLRKFSPHARMTGTGSCLFAPFEKLEEAKKIVEILPKPLTGFVVKGINLSPMGAVPESAFI